MNEQQRLLLAEVLFQMHKSLSNQTLFSINQSEENRKACLKSMDALDESLDDFVKGE